MSVSTGIDVSAAGGMSFRGLVAAPDGSKIYETSREGAYTEEDALRIGREAGEQLLAEAGDAFFAWKV